MDKVHFKPTSDFIIKANKLFEEQKFRINKLIPYAQIHHVGSTAIPNSITKGDLDIVVRVPSGKFKHAIEILKTFYEINQPDNWTDSFASFKDEKNFPIDFGAQLVIQNSKEDDFVKMRDTLRANPDLVEKYNAMKIRHNNKDMEVYIKEKSAFFDKLRKKLK